MEISANVVRMVVQMSDFHLRPEPIHDQPAFAARIAAVLDRGWPLRVELAPGAAVAPSGWKRDADARLVLMLEGAQRYEWHDGTAATGRRLVPGEALWLAPGALMREDWGTRADFLGVVLRPHFLRLLVGRSRGDGKHPGGSPWACHAALPLGEPGTLVAHALDRLAEGGGDRACAPELVRVLLRLASDHALRCASALPGKAAATWQRVQEHIAATCHGEIDRASAARRLGLNPTYLSGLCQRHGGKGFVKLVEEVRLERARVLLRSAPDVPIRVVAAQVGFASAGYFARSFRRATGCTPLQWRGMTLSGLTAS